MAQQTKKQAPKKKASSQGRATKSNSRTKSSAGTRSSAKRRQSANGRSSSRSQNANRRPTSTVATVVSGAEEAGRATLRAAQKAKTPLVAAGAAAVGIVGGLALKSRSNGRKVLGVSVPGTNGRKLDADRITDAAKRLGTIGEQVGRVATEVERVRKKR